MADCFITNIVDSYIELTLRYDLQCKIIFGDDKFHVIESTYTTKSEECDHIYYCTSFTFDGKEYPVEEGGVVTVRLNTAEN